MPRKLPVETQKPTLWAKVSTSILFILFVGLFLMVFFPKTKSISLRYGWVAFLILILVFSIDIIKVVLLKERPKKMPYHKINFYSNITTSLVAATLALILYKYSQGELTWDSIKSFIYVSVSFIMIYMFSIYIRRIGDKNYSWKIDLVSNFVAAIIASLLVTTPTNGPPKENFVAGVLLIIIILMWYQNYYVRTIKSKSKR